LILELGIDWHCLALCWLVVKWNIGAKGLGTSVESLGS